MLSYGFPEPAEVCDKFLIVLSGVDIEAVPEVASDGNASESPFSDLLDVVEADASFGDNLAVYDAVQFKVDRRHWPQLTEMMFMNVFGLPEAVMLRGREEETHELSAEFGYSGWKMVRMDDDVTRDIKVNTGWLTKAERRQYGELYRSPLTGRQEQLGLRRIVVREIEVAYLTPTNEPASFDVTYRYADRRQEWMADLDANTAGHNIFDSTFSVAFD